MYWRMVKMTVKEVFDKVLMNQQGELVDYLGAISIADIRKVMGLAEGRVLLDEAGERVAHEVESKMYSIYIGLL